MKRINCERRSERGTQIAEFALVLPVLVLLALVVTEGASFVRAHLIINNAAREGARLATAAENQPSCYQNDPSCKVKLPDIQAAVVAYATRNGLTSSQCTGFGPASVGITQTELVNVNEGGTTKQWRVSRVQVDCTYPVRYLPRVGAMANGINLRGEAQFRNLY